MIDLNMVWLRIKRNEGESFYKIRGGEFTYEVPGNYITLSTTTQNIPKSHFEEALKSVPLINTVPVQHLRGPSYIYAILMDKRIRQSDW